MKTSLAAILVALFGAVIFTPPLHSEDAGKPDAGEITDLKQVSGMVPHEVLIALLNNAGKEAAASKATDALRAKAEGRTATLKLKIDRVEKDPRRSQNQDGYRVKADDAHLREGGAAFRAYLWVHFSLTENAKIASLKKGDEITVMGKISVASVTAQNTLALHVDVSDATVK